MSRIYKVALKDAKGVARNENEILVRALTKAGALRFAAEKTMDAEVASQDDLIRLVTAGAKVEESAEQEQPAPAARSEAALPKETEEAAAGPRKRSWA